jgi:hypothetical protein
MKGDAMKTLTRPWKQGVSVGRSGPRGNRIVRRWMLGWLGLTAIAIVNGGVRQGVYSRWTTDQLAHQLSTITLLALSAGYVWWMQRHWPLPSTREALRVGAAWMVLTVLFELGLGHYVVGDSWSTLLAAYDVTAGRIWVLVPLWLTVAPALLRRLAAHRG